MKHRAYHATTIACAKEILTSGVFKKGTYFAFKIEDALKFAGPVIFVAEFDDAGFQNCDHDNDWQFWLRDDFRLEELCCSWHWRGVI